MPFRRPGRPISQSSFSERRAKNAGLASHGLADIQADIVSNISFPGSHVHTNAEVSRTILWFP